jgi:hypothetical protein
LPQGTPRDLHERGPRQSGPFPKGSSRRRGAHLCVRPIISAFSAWPTDVLRPFESLWDRLAQRIAAETGQKPRAPAAQPPAQPEWEEAAEAGSADQRVWRETGCTCILFTSIRDVLR